MHKAPLFLLSLLAISFSTTASADYQTAYKVEGEIKKKFAAMEKALNAPENYEEIANVLHSSISNDAQFSITVNNPVMGSTQNKFTLNKEDYINSYIRGTRAIKNYEVAITPLKVQIEGNQATSHEIMVESGEIIDPSNPSSKTKPFVSRTSCQSQHDIDDEKAILTTSTCHTDVTFEEEV